MTSDRTPRPPHDGSGSRDEEDEGPISSRLRHPFSTRARQRFFRAELPTEPMPLVDSLRRTPYRDPRRMSMDEEQEVHDSLDLAVRVGELMLRCGAGTRDVESSVAAVAAASGIERLEIDITNQSLLVQCVRESGRPITVLRVVRSSSKDLARLVAVHEFVERLVAGGFDRAQAKKELRLIRRAPRFWPRWTVSVAYGVLAAAVATLLGAGLPAIVAALVSSVLVDRVGIILSRHDLPAFYVSAAGGAIATVFVWGAFALGTTGAYTMTTQDFAYSVAGGIVVLLPGRAMASAVEDAVTGYPVTGAGRLFGVGLTSAGIIVGVAAGLSLTLRVDHGLDLGLVSPTKLSFGEHEAGLWIRLLAGGIGAAASAVSMRTRRRLVLPTAAMGAGGLLVADLLHATGGIGSMTALGLACAAMGFVGRLVALRMGAPALVLVIPAISPLLPGLRIFRGMYELVSGSVVGHGEALATTGVTTLLGASATALAIVTGLVFGDVVAAPFDRRIVRRRRARRR
jgi:uncharacterized membrane protein YjjP (DUF1212 family)